MGALCDTQIEFSYVKKASLRLVVGTFKEPRKLSLLRLFVHSALSLGTDLLLHGGTVLPLARLSLTAVFGMGTGVSPRL